MVKLRNQGAIVREKVGRVLLCPGEVAEILCISVRTLHDLTKSGDIPSLLVGKRGRRYRLSDIESFLDNAVRNGKDANVKP